jgi:hypothetical protein
MTSDHTVCIRQSLRAKGIKQSQVSVRTPHYGSIEIRIHDPSVKKFEVEEVANPHESIRYDHASGEILSGGNTFVNVSYSERAVIAYMAEHISRIQTLIEGAEIPEGGGGRIVEVDSRECSITVGYNKSLSVSIHWPHSCFRGHYFFRDSMTPQLVAGELLNLRDKVHKEMARMQDAS